jgi:vitamin B12/bleomycin/antimicrobial peptide transport system ATP-binding/permease protein
MASLDRSLWRRFVAVGLPFFRSGVRARAFVALGVLVALLLSINGLNVANSYIAGDCFSALAERRSGRYWLMTGFLVGVFAASTIVQSLARYAEEWLGILWRQWLTGRLLDRYLADHVYHHLAHNEEIDNPDQRLSEDVKSFTATSLSFLVLATNAVLTIVAFSGVLWSIAPMLFFVALGYSILGSAGTVLLGRRLVTLDNLQLKKEANFRYALGRVREHSASIAQMNGEAEEKVRLGHRLDAVVDNFRHIIVVNRNLAFFVGAYNYLPQVIPIVIVANLYISGAVEFGKVTQSTIAFSQLLAAFSLVVTQFQQLSTYAAVVQRLGAIWEATEPGAVPPAPAPTPAPAAAPAPAPASEPQIVFNHLTLHTPGDHRLLIRNLSLELSIGKRVLVTGPNGAGKTALVLATAGLWSASEGEIACQGRHAMMFLPQRSYLPTGRLRDAVLYGLDEKNIPDERIVTTLEQVGLQELLDKHGLDEEVDWENHLSAGEQQALTFARVLLANPCFAFFDSTSRDLDEPHVDRFFGLLTKTSISYVSVGDQPALRRYHDLELELFGDGRWQLKAIKTNHSKDGKH